MTWHAGRLVRGVSVCAAAAFCASLAACSFTPGAPTPEWIGSPHVVAVCRPTPNLNQWIETIAGTEPSFNIDYAPTAKGPWTEVELDIAGTLEFHTSSALGADLYIRWDGANGKVTGPVSADTAACSLSSINGYLYSDTHTTGPSTG